MDLYASRIEDYALLGSGETAALLSRSGSIDWLCWPTFSSGACFAALLGTADHGFWKIAPRGDITRTGRRYRPATMIVETTFETSTGTALLIDFMPLANSDPTGHAPSSVIRIIRGVRGSVELQSDLAIRFDYGRTIPWVTQSPEVLSAVAGPEIVIFRTSGPDGSPLPLEPEGMCHAAPFTIHEGQTASLTLTYGSSLAPPGQIHTAIDVEAELTRAEEESVTWSAQAKHPEPYAEMIERSILTLKALTYTPSGGIVAAPTASLPEFIGGKRNWDYRFCRLRDTSFTLLVLLHAGYTEEAVAWRHWLLRAIAGSSAQLQTIYGICGERQLLEWQATWLPGYENSSPVNIGNGAVDQFQLDIFGEVASALARMPEAEEDTRIPAGALHTALTNHLCEVWQQPDDGIWETRGGRRHFTYSKVSAWVALDRVIGLVESSIEKNGNQDGYPDADLPRWRTIRDQIHAEVCEKGFSRKLNSFTQSYGSEELDASCLRIPLMGFLPMDDPRIVGTIEAIEKNLTEDGFVLRYRTEANEDGLPPGEGAFLACSFWLVINLYLIGRKQDAIALFDRLAALCNDVGLLSEEWDPKAKRMLGNFPQGLSHIALCHAAFTLAGQWKPQQAFRQAS